MDENKKVRFSMNKEKGLYQAEIIKDGEKSYIYADNTKELILQTALQEPWVVDVARDQFAYDDACSDINATLN